MVTYLHIRAINRSTSAARLTIGHVTMPCRIGRAGRTYHKREGDGKTPIGHWFLRQGFYRPDKLRRPLCRCPLRPMSRTDGWCEDPRSFQYNRWVKLPFGPGHETMWRSDEAYDIVFSTSHNERPRVRGAGSAIFFHLTRQGSQSTQGCVAISGVSMRKLLPLLSGRVMLVVWPT